MREKHAALRLESAIGPARSDTSRLLDERDADLVGRVRVMEMLMALDLVGASRIREPLRARMEQAVKERRARAAEPPVRRPWVCRRPLLATELAVLFVVVLLAVIAPRSLAGLVEPVARIIERVRVGEHTVIVRPAPQTGADATAILRQARQRLANGDALTPARADGHKGQGGRTDQPTSAAAPRATHAGRTTPGSTSLLQRPAGRPVRDHRPARPRGQEEPRIALRMSPPAGLAARPRTLGTALNSHRGILVIRS